MNLPSHTLPILGHVARSARALGLGAFLGAVRDASDGMFLRLGTPPLHVRVGTLEIRGFLRHRSSLHGIAHGGSPYFRELFEASLEPGMTVVDGGAHVGFYSLLASRRVGNLGTVMAFEPDPYNYRALSFNILKNRSRNVVAIQRALASAAGKVPFYQNPNAPSSSLIDRKDINRGKRIEAQATTLDHELRDMPSGAILIKLDVEGAEVLALRGMRKILQLRERVVFLLEVHPAILDQAGFSPKDVLSELESNGFQMNLIDERKRQLSPVTTPDGLSKGNFYCRRG